MEQKTISEQKKAHKKALEWISGKAFDEKTRKEIDHLLKENKQEEIEDRFYQNLEFGTGGMRAVMGAGTNRLNIYNIRRATCAVAQEMLEQNPGQNSPVIIGHDSRHNSRTFAEETAGTFAAFGIRSLLFKGPTPVPLVSFAILHHKAQGGIMITASHNPPEYNGYKVFWKDAAQVTPPNDHNIIRRFNSNEDYSKLISMEFQEGCRRELIGEVQEKTIDSYFAAIKSKAINLDLCREKGSKLSLVYTALHGTGTHFCLRALQELGLSQIHQVKEQALPDGDFPTVVSPNPENPESFSKAVKLLKEKDGDLAIGTDPDTDRVGLALLHEGKVCYPNGHQLGILMLHYILSNLKKSDALPEKPYFIKSIVTTPLLESIALSFGVQVENTLTGFKWICRRMNEIEAREPWRNFIFATEESFGNLHHPFTRDKDGVSSVALLAEMALWHKARGKNLLQALDDIYREYGFSAERLFCLDYQGKSGAQKILRIMKHFRHYSKPSICDLELDRKEDYLEKKVFPSNVLGFYFKEGHLLYLRPSGTEPKIKFYIMIQEQLGSLKDKKEQAIAKIEQLISFIKQEVDL